MILEINKNEEKHFINLIQLGNYIINGTMGAAGKEESYNVLAHRIVEDYLIQSGNKKNLLIDDLPSGCENFVEKYEESAFIFSLGQLFADRIFPVIPNDMESHAKNIFAAEFFDEKFSAEGTSILHIDYPNAKEEIERLWNTNDLTKK